MRRLVLGAMVLVACSGTGDDGDDPVVPTWSLELSSLDAAMLAIQPVGSDLLAVGGPFTGEGTPELRVRSDGAWRAVAAPPGWRGAAWWTWNASPSDVWVVGDHGQVARGAVDALAMVTAPTSTVTTLYGVWGSSADDVWIVGGDPRASRGVVLHWDGATLTETATAARVLFKVWGAAADDVMIVGAGGLAWHYDGDAWSATETNTSDTLTTVHGGGGAMYAVGGFNQGVVLAWDGVAWRSIEEPFMPRLSGVNVAADGRVWVAGDSGYLGWYADGVWTPIDTQLLSQFHAVLVAGDDVFGTGGILAISEASREGFVGRYGAPE